MAKPAPPPADPRPRLVREDGEVRLAGSRCSACGYPVPGEAPRCPACWGRALEPARFGPGGVVWSATVIRVDVPGRRAPWALAYVNLDDGPRILAHVSTATAPVVGARVRLAGLTDTGDLLVEVLS